MQDPLTIEQFQYPEFEKGIGKEFITAFINAINNVYEKGRRVKNSGFCFLKFYLAGDLLFLNFSDFSTTVFFLLQFFVDVFKYTSLFVPCKALFRTPNCRL